MGKNPSDGHSKAGGVVNVESISVEELASVDVEINSVE